MHFDKQAVQRELDMAAHELETAGFKDLAERVDFYSDRMMTASEGELPILRRALARIREVANRRMHAAKAQRPEVNKAEHAVNRARRASDERKETLRRRLMAIAAKRKSAARKLAALRVKRAMRNKLAANRK